MNHWEIKTTRVRSAACMTFKSIIEMTWHGVKRFSHFQVYSSGRFRCRSVVCVFLNHRGHSDWFLRAGLNPGQSRRQPEYHCLARPLSLCYLSPCFFPRFIFLNGHCPSLVALCENVNKHQSWWGSDLCTGPVFQNTAARPLDHVRLASVLKRRIWQAAESHSGGTKTRRYNWF